ncbi:MAG: EamA family transporter [Nanoarchaeales archaeon]|nr:EamA family transporter [Nanoarchaeales archaeon]
MNGFLIMIVSAFLYSLKTIITKHNLKVISSNSMIFITTVISSIILFPFVLFYGFPEFSFKLLFFIIINGVIFYFAKYFAFRALQKEDISIIAPLTGVVTLMVMITSFFILSESPTLFGFFGILLVVIGVYLLNTQKYHTKLLDPIKHLFTNEGTKLYMIATLFYGFVVVLDKMGVLLSSPLFWTFIISVVMAVVSSFKFKKNFKKEKKFIISSYKPLSLIIVLYILVHLSQMYAITLILASYVSALKTLNVLFTICIGGLFFKEKNLFRKFLIGCVIIVGVMMIMLF